jgi:hypothetical protein
MIVEPTSGNSAMFDSMNVDCNVTVQRLPPEAAYASLRARKVFKFATWNQITISNSTKHGDTYGWT